MPGYFVYVLRSQKDNKFYIGQTGNLEARIEFHNAGRQKSTKSRIPFELLYNEAYRSKKEALIREKELKTGKGRDFLKQLFSQESGRSVVG